jgi:hypothetical protein
MHEQVRQQRRYRPALWATAIPRDQTAILSLQRRLQPPPHIQQDPPLVGAEVMRHRLDHQLVIEVVEEPFDVKIDHPVGSPAALPARRHVNIHVLAGSGAAG